MRRKITHVLLAVAVVVGISAASVSIARQWGAGEPSVTPERLGAEVFGAGGQADCVLRGLDAAGIPSERISSLLGDDTPTQLTTTQVAGFERIMRECTPSAADERDDEAPPGELPEQPVRQLNIDPEIPIRAGSQN